MPWDNANCLESGVATLSCLPILFQNVVSGLIIVAGLVALSFIIYAGYKYIFSSGDPKKIDEAKHTITYGIIGLLVVLLSFFILNLIATLTGTPCISQFGFSNCLTLPH